MIDLYNLYNTFNSENNTWQGGLFRPERDFERVVNNDISFKIWDEWTAQAEKTQEITDELSPFLKSVQLIVQPTSNNFGLVGYPTTYGRFSSARILLHKDECFEDTSLDTYDCKGVCVSEGAKETDDQKQARIEKYKDGIVEQQIYKVDNSRWGSILNHRTKKPDFENPAMTQYDGGFKVAPRKVSVIVLDYFVKPTYANFIFTIAPGNPQTGSGDYMIYNSNVSGKLQWRESMMPEFLKRLGLIYSKYTRDSQLFQMTQAEK